MKAFVFPGQGSQYPGMGKDLAAEYPVAAKVFEEADDVLGFALSRLCFEGPQDQLILTENTQPALLATSVAALRVLEDRGVSFDYVAGHSLGEYSALVASGSLKFADALRLVRRRGQFMQDAVPVGVGAMAAIIGLELNVVERLAAEAAQGQVVSAANQNSPGQVVVAGHSEAVDRLCRLAQDNGARRALKLPVSAPFHSPLMKPAEQRMRPLLEETDFRELTVPLVNNCDAEIVRSGSVARQGLIQQIASMVRWTDSVQVMTEAGVNTFVEVGAGKVLSGLIRRISPEANLVNIEKPLQVEDYVRS